MSKGIITESYLNDIAVAIQTKAGTSNTMTPSEMAGEIMNIPTTSGANLGHGSFSANGTYNAIDDNLDGYDTVTISVPAEVSLTSLSVSENDTYSAPTGVAYNEVTVAVPLTSISISSNGTYSTAQGGYDEVVVNVLPKLQSKTVSSNTTVEPDSDYDGLSSVVVNVPVPSLITLSASSNRIYIAPSGYGYDQVNVNVPGAVLSTKTITENGTYSAASDNLDGYSTVTVNVSGSGEEKDYIDFDITKSDVIDNLTATSDDIRNQSGENAWYQTYKNKKINSLTITAGDTYSDFEYLNEYQQNYNNQILFNKLILDNTINLRSGSYNNHNDIKEVVLDGCNISSNSVFRSCYSLKKATFRNIVKTENFSFAKWFNNCYSLKKVVLSPNITRIGSEMFRECHSLFDIDTSNVTYIDSAAFYNCHSLQFLNLNNVTHIDSNGFYSSGLVEVLLPNVINNSDLGTSAFRSCFNLKKITLNSSITKIPQSFCQDCYSLNDFDFSNITEIGNYGFNGTGFTNIILPEGFATLGTNSFQSCKALISVTLPSTLTTIPTYCFATCTKLSNVTIANGITSIGQAAFSGDSSLTNITIPNSVTSIGASAFASSGLTTVTIPNNVTSIGSYCFSNCTNLTEIIIDKEQGSISGAPWGAPSSTTITYLR